MARPNAAVIGLVAAARCVCAGRAAMRATLSTPPRWLRSCICCGFGPRAGPNKRFKSERGMMAALWLLLARWLAAPL